ncbi:replication initiation protein [Spiroplasma endosymbiont of Lariophagus distinguendus]|uniref:replication initiation protein n=1 Tax=Spiroplasma endosymbiont of Lariophagus distinguendus TaxID=2935082 RepID=UPI00207A8F87|nr:replication initiation protein [Spiroplasma endosymbiont of Lariophagus distinguendus]
MKNSLGKKVENKFIKKSNVIVRAVTNECAGIMTQRLFNFAILNTKNNIQNIDHIGFWLKDFCNYYGIQQHKLYDKVIHKKREMTIIMKELQILTGLQFFVFIENENKYGFVNTFLSGFNIDGYIKLKINKELITKYFVDLKKDYTNVYLPYTKEVTSKYSMRLYEYLRSYLYMNAKTKKTPNFKHEWDFEQLSNILNLNLNSCYFRNVSLLKKQILEPVKKDLEKTDIIFTYELIKNGRKYNKIILNTHLDLEKFNAQNPELEKVATKKEYEICKKYVNKSKLTKNNFEKQKTKIIKQSLLSDKEVQKILDNIDSN